MLKSVRIQNFRQFKDLRLDGLAQINLITGKNNTGKTSLLEGLSLLDGPLDPSRTVVLAQYRGVSDITSRTRELWSWLFRNGDTTAPIDLRGQDEDGGSRVLTIRHSRGSLIPTRGNGSARTTSDERSSLSSSEPIPALSYEFREGNDDVRQIDLTWTNQGLSLDPDLRPLNYQGFYLPQSHRPGYGEVIALSKLESAGRVGAVVDALRVVEPRLQHLRVLDLGDGARIHADLGQLPLAPLSMMGQGLGKLLTIIVAMFLGESSIYLIDEIGEGFHYSTLAEVWKVIIQTAVQHSVQVFATTHSLETINAAVEGSDGHEGSLAFFRLERRDEDIKVVKGEDFRLRAAVSVGAELR